MLGSKKQTKGKTMNFAMIVGVRDGIEFTREVEATEQAMFYARVVGAVQGMVAAGYHITKVETQDD